MLQKIVKVSPKTWVALSRKSRLNSNLNKNTNLNNVITCRIQIYTHNSSKDKFRMVEIQLHRLRYRKWKVFFNYREIQRMSADRINAGSNHKSLNLAIKIIFTNKP